VTTRISGVKAKTSKSTLGWKSFLRVGRQDGKPDPPSLEHIVPLPNVDRYGLEQKYGKFGKVVGDGAGGSVQLVTRPSNNVTYAVKKFKAKNAGEDEREYVRKIIAEFRIGSQLRHGNIIETLELFEEHKQWYQVMEYAPYCLLASALSREMSTEEIKCSFLQTLAGVDHLHRSGLAHRDLKLENVVVTEGGIMKIIDFGSAAICRHPHAKNVTLATGERPYKLFKDIQTG
jgi:serine/threonine protein kinase